MGSLTPSDLPDIPCFSDWDSSKSVTLPGDDVCFEVLEGQITSHGSPTPSEFAMIPGLVTKEEIRQLRDILDDAPLDTDPDSVDGMCSHEIFLESEAKEIPTNNEGDAVQSVRSRLYDIVKPILDGRITPYARRRYPAPDGSPHRACTPIYSLFRSYKENERRSHPTHRDKHAYATMVISLSDHGTEYRGGIYVATEDRYRHTVPLMRGDALIHQHDLLHGVKVKDDGGTRWSWIVWFRDSEDCTDHSQEWFRTGALNGNPVYQGIYANMCDGDEVVEWHTKAAQGGVAQSMVKLARAYLKKLPSSLSFDPTNAERLYRSAIDASENPDAQYGLAELMLMKCAVAKAFVHSMQEVVGLLEEAAKGGHVFAMFNLGIVHLHGYAGSTNKALAAEWFKASGLPEGYFAASLYADFAGDQVASQKLKARAARMGFGAPWRKKAMLQTGSGGAGGVDINLPWPPLENGAIPQVW